MSLAEIQAMTPGSRRAADGSIDTMSPVATVLSTKSA
jgi:hypothetical protein